MEQPRLEQAIDCALRVHAGQKDKAGEPYILHVLHVMSKMDNETDRIVAILHDVIEDSNTPIGAIQSVHGVEVATAVGALTKRKGESYIAKYIPRVCCNAIARRIKRIDLIHNMNLSRLPRPPTDKDWKRYLKYSKALSMIEMAELDNKD